MSGSRFVPVVVGLAFLALGHPSAAPREGDAFRRIPVAEAQASPDPVAKWDPASPQKLVRLEGKLYQEDAGFYYRVVDELISVRLAPGVVDWDDLVLRATAASPQEFGILSALTPIRHNRLGIIDLTLPHDTPDFWCERIFRTGLVRYAEVATVGVYLVTPNDTLYSQQWALNNTGQTGGTPGADVDAELAWEISTGDPSIVVGVLDSGTLVTHPDLAPNVWHNLGEIPGNSIDDDQNGFTDDVDGWDFENNNGNVTSNNFHGTHVTGVVNARGGNALGVVGLAGGVGQQGVLSMAVGVGQSGPISAIMDDAMLYAVDNGARVVTMSLTVGSTTAFNDAMDLAYNTADVFIDCASGNNGASVGYPANNSNVMAVGSTTHNDVKSSFSNPGPQLEVAAPGSDILSTQLSNGYGTSSGTSFAAPYVGALAALIRGVNPALPASEVRQLIIDTAEDVGPAGFDTGTGWGRINAHQALSQAGSSDGVVQVDRAVYSCHDTVTVTATDFDLAGTGPLAVTVTSDVEPVGETVVLTEGLFSVFSGTFETAGGSAVSDGVLQVEHDDTVTVLYLDEDDGQGGSDVLKTATAATDCAGPQISAVGSESIDDQSATITWTTDEPSSSVVRYSTNPPLDQEESDSTLTQAHSVVLGGLLSCTTYKYEVESADVLANATVEDNGATFHTFQTLGNFPGAGIVPCQLGQAMLDRSSYGCSSTVQVSVIDIDLDLDPGVADLAEVLMTSTSEPAGEWITLTEIALDAGSFNGTIDLTAAAPVANGLLSVAAGDLLTVTYFDGDDGQGQSRVATAIASADCVAPAIENVQVTAISSTRAVISWTTDEPATSRVEFGPDALLGSAAEDLTLETSHALAVSAFAACDRVHFRVLSADEYDDLAVADSGGQPFQFNLNEIGGLVFHDNFETDAGWTLAGEWERGTPLGQGSGSADPGLAFSGSGVLGTDLSGSGAWPGDYEVGVSEAALSPVLNTTGATNLELILRRKLGVAATDSARIFVKKFLSQNVWVSQNAVDDADWVELHYPIPTANNQSAVQIGFAIGSDGSGASYGWNIDELIVKDSTQPDYRTCGNCAGAPSFGGLVAVHDPAPCAASGLTLDWEPAPAWGTGGGGTYDVHRGTTPDFIPDAGNRVAEGLVVTTWNDGTAPLGTPVWYVVRARNDESCAGGEGLEDANLIRLSATETISQPLPASPGDSLSVSEVGKAHVRLTWDAVGADHYVVRRSNSADFTSPVEIGLTEEPLFEDVGVASDGSFYAYRVFSANACGDETP